MLLELEGGPFDGELLARSSRPQPFVWVERAEGGDGYRLLRRPEDGSELYRLVGCRRAVSGGLVLLFTYAQYAKSRCEGCGWFVPRYTECVLCGAPLVR